MHDDRRPRIHVVPQTPDLQRPNACAALRLVGPFSHPTITERFCVSWSGCAPTSPVDILVMQRLATEADRSAAVAGSINAAKAAGARLLYDIDDNLLDAHPDVVSERQIAPHRRTVRLLLREADCVTVSTAPLRDRLAKLSRRVAVLPNALDERRFSGWPETPAPEAGLRIGYFGTFTHLRDLMSIAGPLRAALAAAPAKATLVFCGITQDTRMLSLFEDVACVEILPATGDYESFIDAMRNTAPWDIGLAPLAGGAFETTKSDIKFLEHAAFGIAGLYSDHPAYAAVQHGETGMVSGPGLWADSLSALIRDPALRAHIVTRSRDYLFSHRTLAKAGHALVAVLDEMLEERR